MMGRIMFVDTEETLEMWDEYIPSPSAFKYPKEGARIRILKDVGNYLRGIYNVGTEGVYMRYLGRNVVVFDDNTWYDCYPAMFEVIVNDIATPE